MIQETNRREHLYCKNQLISLFPQCPFFFWLLRWWFFVFFRAPHSSPNCDFQYLLGSKKINIQGSLIMIVTLAQIYTAIALFNAEISVVLMLKIRPTKKLKIQRSVLIKVACSGILRQSEIEYFQSPSPNNEWMNV